MMKQDCVHLTLILFYLLFYIFLLIDTEILAPLFIQFGLSKLGYLNSDNLEWVK